MSKPVKGKLVASFIFMGVIAAATLSFNMPSIAPQPRRPAEDFDKFVRTLPPVCFCDIFLRYRSPYAVDRSSMWKEMDKGIKTGNAAPAGKSVPTEQSTASAP
jgi:hypothetical protein